METYNYTIDSSSSKSSDTYRQGKQLKALTEKYEDVLKKIGITIEDDGKLAVSDSILSGSSYKEIRSAFSYDADYVKGIRSIARRMNSIAYDDVYTQMTGAGGRLNIIL